MTWLIKILGKSNKNKRGFTLIELMVVVIVVGILAAAAIPMYIFALARAYLSEAKATIGTMLTSMKMIEAEDPTNYSTIVFGTGGRSSGTTIATDLMSILGVDTKTNTWWHAGCEDGAAITAAAFFGTEPAAEALPAYPGPGADWKIAKTGYTGPLVWAVGLTDPIDDIQVVYDTGTDTWIHGYQNEMVNPPPISNYHEAKQGFTLIELMVVVTVVGALAAAVIPIRSCI